MNYNIYSTDTSKDKTFLQLRYNGCRSLYRRNIILFLFKGSNRKGLTLINTLKLKKIQRPISSERETFNQYLLKHERYDPLQPFKVLDFSSTS